MHQVCSLHYIAFLLKIDRVLSFVLEAKMKVVTIIKEVHIYLNPRQGLPPTHTFNMGGTPFLGIQYRVAGGQVAAAALSGFSPNPQSELEQQLLPPSAHSPTTPLSLPPGWGREHSPSPAL